MAASAATNVEPANGRCSECFYWRHRYFDFGDCLERHNRHVEFHRQPESYKRNLMMVREDGSRGLDEFLPLRAVDHTCRHYLDHQMEKGGNHSGHRPSVLSTPNWIGKA